MEDSYYKKQTLRPFLIITGILLAVSGGIQIHSAIIGAVLLSTFSGYYYYYSPSLDILDTFTHAEYIAGLVCFWAGLAAIIVLLVQIGSVFDNEKQKTNSTIVLLILFIGFQAFREFYPDFLDWGNGWAGMAILLFYSIFRGISISKVNRQLNVPKKKYGSALFGFYAWSFLLTFIIIIICAVIVATTSDFNVAYNVLIAGFWTTQVQFFIDGIAFGGIGINFLVDSINKPMIKSSVAPRVAPSVTTGVELGMGQYRTKGMERPAILEEQPDLDDEIVLKYCTHCGAQNIVGHTFCDNCGQRLT